MAPAITLQAKRNQIRIITKLPNKTDSYWQRKEYTCKNIFTVSISELWFPRFLTTKLKLKSIKIVWRSKNNKWEKIEFTYNHERQWHLKLTVLSLKTKQQTLSSIIRPLQTSGKYLFPTCPDEDANLCFYYISNVNIQIVFFNLLCPFCCIIYYTGCYDCIVTLLTQYMLYILDTSNIVHLTRRTSFNIFFESSTIG
jgi:hypothetical protein